MDERQGKININESIQYQINRAKEYIIRKSSNDGSEDNIEVCIISDLLRIIKDLERRLDVSAADTETEKEEEKNK